MLVPYRDARHLTATDHDKAKGKGLVSAVSRLHGGDQFVGTPIDTAELATDMVNLPAIFFFTNQFKGDRTGSCFRP